LSYIGWNGGGSIRNIHLTSYGAILFLGRKLGWVYHHFEGSTGGYLGIWWVDSCLQTGNHKECREIYENFQWQYGECLCSHQLIRNWNG